MEKNARRCSILVALAAALCLIVLRPTAAPTQVASANPVAPNTTPGSVTVLRSDPVRCRADTNKILVLQAPRGMDCNPAALGKDATVVGSVTDATGRAGPLGGGRLLLRPRAICVDRRNRSYIADENHILVRMDDMTGKNFVAMPIKLTTLPLFRAVSGVCVDGIGRIYMVSLSNYNLYRVDDMTGKHPVGWHIQNEDPANGFTSVFVR